MKLVDEFRKIAGDIKILDKPEEREMYSHDIGDVPPIMTEAFFKTLPDFVVQPKNVDEIKKVLAFANDKKIPVIPRGAASWGFGGVIPTNAGSRHRPVPLSENSGDQYRRKDALP